MRPTAAHVWEDRCLEAGDSAVDAPLDDNPVVDQNPPPQILFFAAIVANGWFVKPKSFVYEPGMEPISSRFQKALLRWILFFSYGSLLYLYYRQHRLEGRLALGWHGQSATLDRPLSKWADRLSLRLINISEFRLFYFCGRQRTLLQDDVVLTSLQFSKSGTWHPADPALLTKFDMDIHRP